MFGVSRRMAPATAAHGKTGCTSDANDFDSIGCILAHCGLEPAWAGSVEPSGELFYLEAGSDSHHADYGSASLSAGLKTQPDKKPPDSTNNNNKKKKTKKNLAALQKIINPRRKAPGLPVNNADNGADDSHASVHQHATRTEKPGRGTAASRSSGGHERLREVSLVKAGDPKSQQTSIGQQADKLEAWLGIVSGADARNGSSSPNGVSTAARGRDGDRRNGWPASSSTTITRETRLVVRGLIPSGSAVKSGEIELGDVLVSINGIPVSAETVGSVLASMANASVFKLQMQSGGFGSWEKYIVPPQRPAVNGTLVKMISGDRLQTAVNPLRDVCHIVTYLTMGNEDDEEGKDILYEFPKSAASRKLSDIRGLFITLSDMLQNITDSAITSTSILVENELIHVAYQKSGNEVLVLGVPASRAPVFLLDCILKDVVRLLRFLFKTLDGAFREANHQRLNHLFSLLLQRLLLTGDQQSQRTDGSAFLEALPGTRWLDLPEEVKINIDSCLSELEAADFAYMSDDHYDDRRPYVLLGSCLFYKGYVMASHLATEDLRDVSIYCRNYSLMALCSQQPVGQLVIWREVHPTRRSQRTEPAAHGYQEPEGRWFLLIVGQKHSLLCLLLEAGGCASQCEGSPAPDPFYVDQARATLLHLESLNIPVACEERLSAPPIPALSCADWFFPSRKSGIESGTPPLPIQASPMLSKLHSQSPVRGRKLLQADLNARRRSSSPGSNQLSANNANSTTTPSPHLRRHTAGRLADSDNESDTASPYNSRTNSTQSSPVIRRRNGERKGSDVSAGSISSAELYKVARKKRLIPDPYNMGMMHRGQELQCNDYFTATKLTAGCDNTLFHYVHLDAGSGIIACPTHSDLALLGGSAHAQLVQTFHRCCIAIRQVLSRSTRLKARPEEPRRPLQSDHSIGYVREHGVMFKCQPESRPESKKSPPSINYWVVGRLFEEPQHRECYVCHHESATQNVVELAFKLSFGAGL